MSNRTLALTDSIYQYMLDHSLRESPALKALREATAQHEWARMQIAPEQGQFMALLVELTGARKILEIGTYTGYSALAMAQVLPDDGQLVCCDISEEWTGIARSFWQQAGVDSRIELRIAPALQTLDELSRQGDTGHFDLVFVDADKENYPEYFERSLKLLRTGGLVLFDNTLWNGDVADPTISDEDTLAIRVLNDRLHRDERVSISLVPIGDGLTLARKR